MWEKYYKLCSSDAIGVFIETTTGIHATSTFNQFISGVIFKQTVNRQLPLDTSTSETVKV